MKKITALLTFTLLTGCLNIPAYEPTLAERPSDLAKYKLDVQDCRDLATPDVAELLNTSYGTFGSVPTPPVSSIGVTSPVISDHGPRDFFATVDECMKRKGYELASRDVQCETKPHK